MTITSISDYKSSLRERPMFVKTAARAAPVSVSVSRWTTLWDGTGTPGAGALAVGNTANGVVPTDATTGAPTIRFSSGTGYLTNAEVAENISGTANGPCRFFLYDRLFHAGAYAFNAATALASQPSFASRVPGGTDFSGLQIWWETVTTFTGIPSIEVIYTNQSGNAGHTTGVVSLGVATTIGDMFQLPLASGDSGVSKIESVTCTVATIGTFNIIVARPLMYGSLGRVLSVIDAYFVRRWWMDRLSMTQVFSDSCIAAGYIANLILAGGSAPTPTFDFGIEIASK